MLEPLVVKATRAVPRREGRSNPPDLSNEFEGAILHSYPTIIGTYCFNIMTLMILLKDRR